MKPGRGRDRPNDPYALQTKAQIARLDEFTIQPVSPAEIVDRRDAGEMLVSFDAPAYLGRRLFLDTDTSLILYRLVQLFGTPNVPGIEAGADQPARETRTWQYLFEAIHDPEEGEGWRRLVSVYDHKTNVSVGLAEWRDPDETLPEGIDGEFPFPEPVETEEVPPWLEVPPEEDLKLLITMVRLTVEHAVEATYKDLWV